MDTRIVLEKEFNKAKELWYVSFGDSPEFIDNYFSTKVERDNIYGVFESGRLVSMLVALPRIFMIRGTACKSVFIAGCCTAPDSRNKGYMKGLLSHTANELSEKGCFLGFLHPFNHAFYRKLGWNTVSDMIPCEALPLNKPVCSLKIDSYDSKKMLDIYKKFVSGCDFYFARDINDTNIRINEHLCDGGHILCDYEKGWYCLFFVEDDIVNVIENTCRDNEEYSKMIYELSAFSKTVRYLRPGAYGSGEYTMMRVFDDMEALRLFGHTDFQKADVNRYLCDELRNGSSLFFEQY